MRVIRACVVMVALVCFSATASADVEVSAEESADVGASANSIELGIFAGGWFSNYYHQLFSTSYQELEAFNPQLGLRLAYFPLKYVGVEGELQYTVATTVDGDGAPVYGFRAHAIGQYPELGMFVPFATAGIGLVHMASADDVLGSDTEPVGHLGVGARLFLTPSFAFRLEGRLLRGRSWGPGDGDSGANFAEVLLGFSYVAKLKTKKVEPVPDPDPDGDGVLGDLDLCPEQAATTPDGCPPKDGDGDGFLDPEDKCPTEAENVNNWEDEDGCPDTIPDTDGDMLNDLEDKCKDQAEDVDGHEDEDGCPDPDNDSDGVMDLADSCVDKAGPPENRGCPDTDRDSDGVVDRLDNCPDEAGTADNHGCKKKQLVVLTKEKLEILDKVFFRTGRATLRARSRPLLNNIGSVLAAHPEIKKIRVEGHTDDKGDDAKNKALSQKRAQAVVDYLVKKGVDATRLEAVGFGEDNPIEDNGTKAGRAANRRVEFSIVQE